MCCLRRHHCQEVRLWNDKLNLDAGNASFVLRSWIRMYMCSAVPHVRFGSKADMCAAVGHVRFTPESGSVQRNSQCLLWAKSGRRVYSITSSARVSREAGIVMPSALAVFILITVSNLVGACTGRSDGFSPFRTRST